jgi:hypothetical protein
MTDMHDREQGFEAGFAHDAELTFRLEARCTKLFGHWVAGVLKLAATDADAYAQSLVAADMAEAGQNDVLRKVTADLQAKQIDVPSLNLEKKLAEFMALARTQLGIGV